MIKRVIENPATTIVQQQVKGKKVKVLVNLQSGEQRLIKLLLPVEDCTVQDLLELLNDLTCGLKIVVSLVNDEFLGINYIVDLPTRNVNEQNDSKYGWKDSSRNSGKSSRTIIDENSNNVTSPNEEPKNVEGKRAVCPTCSSTIKNCQRCKKNCPQS